MSTSSLASHARSWAWLARGAITLAGLIAFVYAVSSVGAGRLLDVAARAGVGILLLVVLELAILGLDTHAAHTLSGAGMRATLRGAVAAYATSLVLPGGRVAGEIARIDQIRGDSGLGRSVHASLLIQASHVASTVLAIAATTACVTAPRSLLALLVGVATWNTGLACLLIATPRSGRAVSKLAGRLGLRALSLTPVAGRAHGIAMVFLGRAVHVLQAIVAVCLVTNRLDVGAGSLAECLQLLAASAGDAVPGQVGVVEATFDAYGALFDAHDLGAGVAIALLLRASRLALLGPLGLAWWMTRRR